MSYEITTASSRLEIDTQYCEGGTIFEVDANHFIYFWAGSNIAYAQILAVNTSTWAVTTAASRLAFHDSYVYRQSCYEIDANHFINFYGYGSGEGNVQVFAVNTSTWAVTTAGSMLEYGTAGDYGSSFKIDANHFIYFWGDGDGDGNVQVFTVNTSTWAVTTANSPLEFDTQDGDANSCSQIDANHFINFYQGVGTDGYVQVFEVNTTTWAVTTASAKLEFDTDFAGFNSCHQIDANHFINFWNGYGSTQIFEVNTTTWAVTTASARLQFANEYCRFYGNVKLDDNHFVAFYQRDGDTESSQVFEVNTTTWVVTTCSNVLEFNTQSVLMTRSKHAPVVIDSGSHILNVCNGEDYDGFAYVISADDTSTQPSTYDIATSNDKLAFDSVDMYNSCYQIDSGHFINFYSGVDNDGFAQVFTINTSTWAVSTASAKLEFDTTYNVLNSCYPVDTNHFINFWGGISKGIAQIFEINTSTWVITTANSFLEFFDTRAIYNRCFHIDANHFINFWSEGVQVFEVNTSTWVITTAASKYAFSAEEESSCYQIDDNHFINFWVGPAVSANVQIFEVDTSTWAITTASSVLNYDSQYDYQSSCYRIDANHFVHFYCGPAADGFAQVFEVNTTTWAVATASSKLEFDTQLGTDHSCYQVDSNHFINFYKGVDSDGFVQFFEVNPSTWAITTAGSKLEFDTQNGEYNSCGRLDDKHFINFWSGFAQAFNVEGQYAEDFSEAFSISESFKKSPEKIDSDDVSFLEVIAKSQIIPLSDSLSFNEAKVLEIEKILTECLNLNVIALKSTFEKVFDEVLTLAESLIKLMTFEKTFTETETLVETFSKESGKTLSESISFLEDLRKGLNLFPSEVLSLNEAKEWEVGKKITDSLVLTKILTKNIDLSETATISLSESILRILEAQRDFSETLALIENIAPITAFKRTLISVLTLAETISKFAEQTLEDSLTLTDSILPILGISLTESIAFLPVAPKFSIKRSLLDTLTLLEISYSEKDFKREFTDNLWINRLGGTLNFDGDDDYVDCGNDASLNITGNITVEAWVKSFVATPAGPDGRIADKHYQNAFAFFQKAFVNGTLKVIVNGVGAQTPEQSIQANKWHHAVFVYNRVSIKIYIDGIEKASQPYSAAIGISGDNLYIGNSQTFSSNNWNGLIDEARIYNRALAADEIKEHYKGIFQNESGLVGHWNMNEGSGDVVADSSGEGNDGIRHGATWVQEGAPKIKNFLIESVLKKIESISLIDVFKKISSLSLTETVTLTEAFEKIAGLKKTDSLTMSETFSKRIALQKADNITLAEIVALDILIRSSFYETLLLNESFAKEEQRVLSDLFSLVEVFTKLSDTEILKGETLILTESLEKDSEKSLTDDFILSDRMVKYIRIDLVDNLDLIEILTQTSTFDLTLQEALVLIESLSTIEKESIPQKVVLLTKGQKTHLFFRQ